MMVLSQDHVCQAASLARPCLPACPFPISFLSISTRRYTEQSITTANLPFGRQSTYTVACPKEVAQSSMRKSHLRYFLCQKPFSIVGHPAINQSLSWLTKKQTKMSIIHNIKHYLSAYQVGAMAERREVLKKRGESARLPIFEYMIEQMRQNRIS